jgi:hypothetical protein
MAENPQGAPSFPLELSGKEMRRIVSDAMDRIVAHIESLPEQPSNANAAPTRLITACPRQRASPAFPRISSA